MEVFLWHIQMILKSTVSSYIILMIGPTEKFQDFLMVIQVEKGPVHFVKKLNQSCCEQ